MIELRWLCDPRNDYSKVLQYRTSIPFNGKFQPKWSEWKTVPEVDET